MKAGDLLAKPSRTGLKKWLTVAALGVLLLGFVVSFGVQAWYSTNLKPVAGATEVVQLRIEPGESSAAIAAKLEKSDLIRNAWVFRFYLRRAELSDKIQAGLYFLTRDLSVPELAEKLATGDTAVHNITIIGGMSLAKITELLASAGYERAAVERALAANYPYDVLTDKPPNATLEGYLFPDTYGVEVDQPVEQLIQLILENTEAKITTAIRAGWAAQGLNVHEGLTLASIVQKEDSVPEHQTQIAQVFLKRLAIGRKLEADPTFEYAAAVLGVEASLTLDSPYNTYLYEGLPPTPIATAEASALEAVANPASTDWLYFLHDSEGNIHFSTTEENHKQNIEKYLR